MIITNSSCLRDTQPTANTELHRHERHNKWFKFLEWQLLMNSSAAKARKTIVLSLILVVSLIGNSLIGIIVYKTPNLRKPINFFIANSTWLCPTCCILCSSSFLVLHFFTLHLTGSCFYTSHLFCFCYFTPSSCSLILGELEAFRNYKGISIISRKF